jgi:uncharacterized protein YukE
VSGIEVDPERVSAYAKTTEQAATDLSGASETLSGAHLSTEAFGELGRTVRTAEAYSKASSTLLGQLSRAVEALHAASTGLDKVAESHRGADEDAAKNISRAHQG